MARQSGRAFCKPHRAKCNRLAAYTNLVSTCKTAERNHLGGFAPRHKTGTVFAKNLRIRRGNADQKGETFMNLVVWLPAMFVLGLATMGLMFAFVAACERV
jgi:hypothetical protein